MKRNLLFMAHAYGENGSFDPFTQRLLDIFSENPELNISVAKPNEFDILVKSLIARSPKFLKKIVFRLFAKYGRDENFRQKYLKKILKKTIKNSPPDLVFALNREGLGKEIISCLPENSKIISWFIDSYERISERYLANFSSRDFVYLVGEREHFENFLTRYPSVPREQVRYLPFGTDTDIFRFLNLKRDTEIVFVGTAFENKPFHRLLSLLHETGQKENLRIFLDLYFEHRKNYIFNFQDELLKRGFDAIPVQKHKKLKEAFFDVTSTVDGQISTEKRVCYLSALCQHDLKIYGPSETWIRYATTTNEELLKKNQFMGIETPKELATVYNGAKIAINIQHYSANTFALSIRNFDIMACGALLLIETSAKVTLENLGFVENEDFVCFSSIDELKEKVRFYLSDENESKRKCITESAYKKISEKHGLRNRLKEILDLI